jgi:hypothetical protein
MFAREARWIGERLAGYPALQLSPLLDVGSSTSDFRSGTQPWIEHDIFAPLAGIGVEIVHLDARSGPGIDIRADLLDDADFARLKARGYRSLLCCNILEHVRDAGEFACRCSALVTPGGLIVATVPRSYPRHGDPIDTLYRPTPQALAALFPDTTVLAAEIVDTGESYRDEVRRRPWILLRHAARLPVPFLGLDRWRHSMTKPYWLFNNYRISAVALRRQ